MQKVKELDKEQSKELDKACSQHDMTYGYIKDLPRRTTSNKVLRDKAFDFAKNPKCDEYQKGLYQK